MMNCVTNRLLKYIFENSYFSASFSNNPFVKDMYILKFQDFIKCSFQKQSWGNCVFQMEVTKVCDTDLLLKTEKQCLQNVFAITCYILIMNQ